LVIQARPELALPGSGLTKKLYGGAEGVGAGVGGGVGGVVGGGVGGVVGEAVVGFGVGGGVGGVVGEAVVGAVVGDGVGHSVHPDTLDTVSELDAWYTITYLVSPIYLIQ